MKVLRKKRIARMFAFMCVVVMMACLFTIPALAANELSGTGIAEDILHTTAPVESQARPGGNQSGNANQSGSTNKWFFEWGLDKEENQVNIDTVTTDEVNQWVERKGNDVISIIQTFGKVMAVIGFFASIICIIVGAIGNHRMMTGGFIGMVIAASAYVAITQGKDLINLFSSWVMS